MLSSYSETEFNMLILKLKMGSALGLKQKITVAQMETIKEKNL